LKSEFDEALNENVVLVEAKKIFHEMKFLEDRIEDLGV